MTTEAAAGAPTASPPAPSAAPGGSMLSVDTPPAAATPPTAPAAPSVPTAATPPADPKAAPAAPAKPTGTESDWRMEFGQGLDDDLAKDWQTMASRIPTKAALVKNYVESQKEIRTRFKVPGADAKPEEWGDVWSKLGRPEKPQDYKFAEKYDGYEMDDADKAYRDGMAPALHRIGLNQWQVSEIEKSQVEQLRAQKDAAVARVNDTHGRYLKQMQTEWGNDFDRNIGLARQELQASPRAAKLARMQLADGTFLGEHPDFVGYVHQNGSYKAEDDRTPSPFNAAARQSAQEQLDGIYAEMRQKGIGASHPEWKTYQAKIQPLMQRVNGTGPSSGATPFMHR